MSTSLNDRSANSLSDMAYIADKLEQIKDMSKYDNIGKIFYNNDGTLRTEFKDAQGNEISGLKEYAQRINDNREMYSDVLGSKLVGTADDESGYKGIAVQNSDGSVTIASARTDSVSAMDVVSDFQMAMEDIPLQLDSAKSFVEKLKNDKDENGNPIISVDTPIDFTGHSLGGSLSELLAVDLAYSGNIRLVKAFESYGIKGIIDNNPELASKYYTNQALIDSMVRSYVSEFDPCCNWARQIGTPVDAFSKDGIYTQQNITNGGLFYHQLDRYGMLVYGDDGNIVQGQIDYKSLLKAMQNDPANLENYLALYDAVKGFEPYDPNGKSSLDNFVSDCLSCNAIDGLFPLTGTAAMLDSIMAANSQYKSSEAAFITPPRRDPITVDMDNDGVETTDTAGGVYFDLDGNGTKEKTGWVKADDGFLVMDRDGNGAINSGKELFGDQTIIKTTDGKLKTAETGFEALSAEDSNGDKTIDSSDENFNKLKVWKDANQDGISQANELQSLEDAGIKKIHLDYLTVNADDGHGNIQTRTSGFEFADGRTGVTGEFLFNRDTIDTQNSDFSNVATDILSMPYLRGFGQVTDLHHAMASDESLKTLVTEFCNKGSTNLTNSTNHEPGTTNLQISEVLTRKFESILFKWCGVDEIDANSRGGNIDAKKLAVLEKIFAENFEGFGAAGTGERSANPNAAAAAQLNIVYNNIKDRFFANMLLQSHLKEYVALGAVELNEKGEVKVNEQIADFILNFQKKTADYRPETTDGVLGKSALPQTVNGSTLTAEAHQISTDNHQLFSLKFYALASTIKALGTAAEKEEFVTYFVGKGEGIYADGLSLFSTNKILIGGGSNDVLTGDNSDNKIYGFEGSDTISGGVGNDTLSGGDGNDVIYGDDSKNSINYSGDDTLIGGKGDDYLAGGEHNDTYIYRRGDGNDIIEELDTVHRDGWSYDKVKFEDINSSDIYNTVKSGNDFIVTFKDANGSPGEKITFKNWFYGDLVNRDYNMKVEEIEFADGTRWDMNKIESNILILGTENNDIIPGSFKGDTIYAGAGTDTINPGDGNDVVYAGDGDDIITGETGNDTLSGEDGNDVIYGDDSKNSINYSGDDTLIGGKGDDYLAGGEHNDTYIYRRGDGNDIIEELDTVHRDGWSYDKVKFEDINSSDIYNTVKSGNDFIVTFKDANGSPGEKITFKNWFYGDLVNRDYNMKVEEIEFADGTRWDMNKIESNILILGTENNDIIPGSFKGDTIYAGAGTDTINPGDGNDVVYAGDDDDIITGETGNDTLSGEDGNDVIYGDDSKNSINYSGDDTLIGGKGDDYLAGGEHNDTYIYRRGDGNDIIEELDTVHRDGWSYDKVKLEDINPSDIYNTVKSGNDFIVTFKDANGSPGEKITFKNWFYGDLVNRDYNMKVEEIEFADGTKWDTAQIEANVFMYGTEGNDEISGSLSNDTVFAEGGDDKINSNNGNDTIYAGAGTDTINPGDGNDVVYAGDDDDIITGETGNDTLSGEDGNDVIYGDDSKNSINYSGDDTLIGGKGDDYLAGGEHNDTYIYRRGDGNDIIEELDTVHRDGWSYDKVKLEDINPSDIYNTVKSGNDFIVTFKDANGSPGEKITFKNWFYGDLVNRDYNIKVEEIEFADGTKWDTAQIEANVFMYGTEGNDEISGSLSNDTVFAEGGDDKINSNNGNDTIYAGAGIDTINPGDGNDLVYAGDGDDIITGETGNDTLSGEDGNDVIYGDDSKNSINYGGDDTLIGGKGDDYLAGGEHNDTYIYRRGDGNDIIEELDSVHRDGWSYDKVKFEDINSSDIYNTVKSGNDFIVTFKDANGSPGEKITFKNWFYGDLVNRDYNMKVEEIEFADGTKWDTAQIEANVFMYGTEGNDEISGSLSNDTVFAEGGDDKINSNNGNDTIYAGAGTDTINPGDGNDLVYAGGGDDIITGETGNDTLSGEDGNDVIYGDDSKNSINYSGDDTLIGGKGDDYLAGGEHNDTYIYRRGDGNDIIEELDSVHRDGWSYDKVKFEDINLHIS